MSTGLIVGLVIGIVVIVVIIVAIIGVIRKRSRTSKKVTTVSTTQQILAGDDKIIRSNDPKKPPICHSGETLHEITKRIKENEDDIGKEVIVGWQCGNPRVNR